MQKRANAIIQEDTPPLASQNSDPTMVVRFFMGFGVSPIKSFFFGLILFQLSLQISEATLEVFDNTTFFDVSVPMVKLSFIPLSLYMKSYADSMNLEIILPDISVSIEGVNGRRVNDEGWRRRVIKGGVSNLFWISKFR